MKHKVLLSLIVKPTGEILFYRNNTYFLLALSIGIFLLNDNKNVLIGYFAMVIVQIVFAFGFLLPAGFCCQEYLMPYVSELPTASAVRMYSSCH